MQLFLGAMPIILRLFSKARGPLLFSNYSRNNLPKPTHHPCLKFKNDSYNNIIIRTDRYCKRTTVVNGITIPKGAVIAVPISVLHHSPLYWKDPEKFDPDRFMPTHDNNYYA